MVEGSRVAERSDEMVSEELATKLASLLDSLPHKVTIYLFTKKGRNDTFNDAARNVISVFSELSSKVRFEEHGLDHVLAKKIGVELTENGFIKHDSHHRTNVPEMYSAGDVEGGFMQIVTAVGQGAEAALAMFEDLSSPYWKGK